MGKGISHIIGMFIIFSVFVLMALVIPLASQQLSYTVYRECISTTLWDIDSFIEILKKTKSKSGAAFSLKLTSCVEDVFLVNGQDWMTLKTGNRDVKCDDNADAHILLLKRDYSYWSIIQSPGERKDKLAAKLLAPDVICRDIYDLHFKKLPTGGKLEGPDVDEKTKIYCLKYQVYPDFKYVEIHNWDTVDVEENCII